MRIFFEADLFVVYVAGMYSLYQPMLSDNPSGSAATESLSAEAGSVGYQVLAAASDGQLTLTEITPKLEKTEVADDDIEDEVEHVTADMIEHCAAEAT